ncbi:hypothetical protein [Streptacidiphilus rugosus]|uniref:hypothetical protein n=1 Tax=Streptacidiphilus rugosus TaxID=405783 RepID=UPI00056AE81B|nr:hypothetical protein [Streptacidiphilus rugosus]
MDPGPLILTPQLLAQLPNGWTATPGWTLQMRRSALDRYLIELIRPGVWAQGIENMLANPRTGQPWPHYRGEDDIWV